MHISELDTPALLIDLDIMERNLARTADYAREHNLRLRPHTKTHKIPALARRQIELGAAGFTVAKTSEAEVMIEAEPEELLIAYPVVGEPKLERLIGIARRTRVTVALDSVEAAEPLSRKAKSAGITVGVLAEFDAGLGRAGVQPGREVVDLARSIGALPGLELEGVAFYPGHIKAIDESGLQALDRLAATVEHVVEDFDRAGLSRRIVSGGSTPTLFHSHRITGMNEIRPGTYIFNDRNCVACGTSQLEDCAASILTTVVSTARHGGMLIDGGSKTFSSDRLVTGQDAYFGHIVEEPGARFLRMNEEHGYVDWAAGARRFRVGEKVRVIPNHICVATNLHEQVYAVRAGEVVESWRVAARGKLQ